MFLALQLVQYTHQNFVDNNEKIFVLLVAHQKRSGEIGPLSKLYEKLDPIV